jgi:site-specific recombinase XerD
MNKLETTINSVLQQLKPELATETWESRRRYFNQMLKLADSFDIHEPSQKLYDIYIANDNGSKERRSLHTRCVKLLDKAADTKAKDEHGKLFNEPPMPSRIEAKECFANRQYPLADSMGIDYLIVKAEMEMRHLRLTESTIGQYRHAWMDIRQYFRRHGSLEYDVGRLQCFLREMDSLCGDGSMKEWKWKINRKAAHVLMEVADTGQFHWGLIRESVNCVAVGMEPIRAQYLTALKQRNLSESAICLHDYVFRKLVPLLGIETSEDLFSLSPGNVQHAIIAFADICNSRSMAALLPIVRSQLLFFYSSGYAKRDLSGIVMNGFIQKGTVASYISEKDQAVLFERIKDEPNRTKAIVFLALKLGLRDCDVINLTFQEIDWRNDKIRLLQKKTGKPLALPLLPDVGNALMEYIQKERPKRDERYPYVFLRKQAPYNKIASAYHICSRLLKRLGIKPVNGVATGVHVFRYTMVHRLLAAKTPHQVITDALGHISKESDKPYLSMEESMLRMCALDLSAIGKVSWKGGI